VELKNGETFNGNLFNIDTWMNLNLRDVIQTSRDGESFWSLQEMYIRGNTIKYLRVPDVVVDVVAEEKLARESSVCNCFGWTERYCFLGMLPRV
jgi:U6 snRNA-associated Sm-like protein LSm4